MANTGTSYSTSKDPMVDFVVAEFERYKNALKDRFDEAQKVIDQWNNVSPTKTFDWMNSVHVPITFTAEQTITPRIFSALFPNDAPLDIIVDGDTSEQQGILIKTALQFAFKRADVQGECLPAFVQNTIIGTGYIEAPYLYKKGWQVGRMGDRYFTVIERRPDCKSVNYFEMFPHPAKLAMDDGLPLVRRRYCDAEYLKKLAESPEAKFENLKAALDSDMPVESQTVNLETRKREEYELLEYWGPWDESYKKDDAVVTKKAVPYWISVVNRTVKVRGIPNPYNFQHPPYCKFTLFSDARPSWFGVGIGQVGRPTQERLNKMVNQRLDNVDLVLNKQGFYNGNDPLINTRKLQISKPGQWHKVSDTVNSIRWMDTPDVTSSSYKEEELAKADYREATGAVVPLMPADEGQHSTAAGINLLQGAAGIRFKPVLKKIEKDLISNLAMMFLSHLQQFMVLPEWMKLTTNDGTEQPILIRPEDLQAKVEILPTGVSETLNKEVQIGQLLRFKEISINDPTVNQAELNKRIAELMGFKDINRFIIQQKPIIMGENMPGIEEQEYIQKRLAEGASPEQIKLEVLGQPGGTAGGPQAEPKGQTPEIGQPVQQPMIPTGPKRMMRP
jgi:hypothetical protein